MQAEQKQIYVFDDLVLDVRKRGVFRGKEPITLNAKAFDLLLFFVENAGRVVGKDEILDSVWKDQFVEESNLTVQISAIRKALKDQASDPRFLATVPGRGYQFIAVVKASTPPEPRPEVPETVSEPLTVPERSKDELPAAKGPESPIGKWLIAGVASAVVLVVVLTGAYFWSGDHGENGVSVLAVLPFANQTGSPGSDLISEGLAESVIFTVSRLPNIRVMSSSSSFRYGDSQADAIQIGKDLGVDAVLTGRLTRNDEKVVVRTEMISTRDNSVIWGEIFVRDRDDIEKLQIDIARSIGRRLAISLRTEQTDHLNKEITDDPEAYQLYLAGRQHMNRLTDDGFFKARDSFKAAIDKDGGYALAHAGLAEAYNHLSGWGAIAPNDGFPLAKASAIRAIELDDTLAEGHNQLAIVKLFYDLDISGAEIEFGRAIELNPNLSDAHQMYSYVLALRDSFAEARASASRAIELDPLSVLKRVNLGNMFYFDRDFPGAIEHYRRALEMDSNSGLALWSIGNAFIGLGMYEEAIAALESSIKFSGASPDEPASLAVAKALSGDKEGARTIIADLHKRSAADQHIPASMFAMSYGALGERDRAFDYLQQAIRDRDQNLPFLKIDSLFDPIRDDPRFEEALLRIGVK